MGKLRHHRDDDDAQPDGGVEVADHPVPTPPPTMLAVSVCSKVPRLSASSRPLSPTRWFVSPMTAGTDEKVMSPSFAGLSLVKQHQAVYAAPAPTWAAPSTRSRSRRTRPNNGRRQVSDGLPGTHQAAPHRQRRRALHAGRSATPAVRFLRAGHRHPPARRRHQVRDGRRPGRPRDRQGIKEIPSWPTIPSSTSAVIFVGGSDIMMEMYESGELQKKLGQADKLRTA